jgi:aminomethyltransferase
MQTLLRTPLYERHVALGARMVPFAGWEMPVQYEGVIPEHRAVREDCGVFDVSHMGRFEFEGPKVPAALQALLSNDIDQVAEGGAQYTLLTNDRGGIIDDLIVYRVESGRFVLVVNASNRETDFEWIMAHAGAGTDLRDKSDEFALLAVQGPRSLERLGLDEGTPFTWEMGEVAGIEVMVNRTGYTGEKGVELMVMTEDAVALWDAVVERGAAPCGLGARDTLRLEVCYPLYGNDLSVDRGPIEAGLGWAAKEATGFIGSETVARTRAEGPREKLAPFVIDGQGIPRQGNAVVGGGEVTSGTMSPSMGVGIGMAYVPADRAKPDTPIEIEVRGKTRPAIVKRKPLYTREDP